MISSALHLYELFLRFFFLKSQFISYVYLTYVTSNIQGVVTLTNTLCQGLSSVPCACLAGTLPMSHAFSHIYWYYHLDYHIFKCWILSYFLNVHSAIWFMCVCICSVYLIVCMRTWIHVCVCIETRGLTLSVFIILNPIFWAKVSHWTWSTLVWISEPQEFSCLWLPLPTVLGLMMHGSLAIEWVLGIWTQLLMLVQ